MEPGEDISQDSILSATIKADSAWHFSQKPGLSQQSMRNSLGKDTEKSPKPYSTV